jgi:FkbH-like protein
MATSAIDKLQTVLDEHPDDQLPQSVRWLIQLGVAQALMARGDLGDASAALQRCTPTTEEQRRQLAREWLRIAAQRENDAQEPAALPPAEGALARAVAVDASVGQPALAGYLQRRKRWHEAARAWRQAISSGTGDANAYLSLARAHERMGEFELAAATYIQLVEAIPTARSYLTVAPRLADLAPNLPEPPKGRTIRVALLGNSTLDHLASYVALECYRAGLRPSVYQAGFDQTTQEILDPASGLYGFNPDVVICAIHASRFFPQIHQDPFALTIDARRAEIGAGMSTLQDLLDVLTGRTNALVLVHNMVAPQNPAIGILDWRDELGQSALFSEINNRIASLARTRYRTVHILDEEKVQSTIGKRHATDPRLWLTARVAWSDAQHLALAREYVRFLKPLRGLTRKCIVLDLDNTLWGGVVGEDGSEGLQLGADAPGNAFIAFQRELERLWRRGILLAVCSKNNFEDVAPVFDAHPAMILKWDHVAAHRINWSPKATNLREIAAELNIGLDSLVFLDDNPVERAAVRAELPEVLVPELASDPAQYRTALLQLDVFESLGLTAEDRQRGQLYAEQAQRRAYEASAGGTSIADYLAGLKMDIEISRVDASTLGRIAQLTNKTNQFNVTTRRYTEADILALLDEGFDAYGMRVKDRFGDNGLVGVAILGPLRQGLREIDTLLLSCRVMGRGVEGMLLRHLADAARATGAAVLRGRFIPTAKNAPARDCYGTHAFSLTERLDDGSEVWDLDLARADVPLASWFAQLATGARDAVLV